MGILKNSKRSKFSVPAYRGTMSIIMLVLFTIMSTGTNTVAWEDEPSKENENKGMIINRHGTKIGSIDEDGNIYNISGTVLGSVDKDGNIFNVSKINIGKVTEEGKVMNQSGTVLGTVNTNGEIYNVSGLKMGEVKGENDLKRTGGVARVIVLK